ARTVAGLASLVIVVEAEKRATDLAGARLARELGRGVAAVPGRVSSPLAAGTNGLLKEGAALIGGAADALELLYGDDGAVARHERGEMAHRAAVTRLQPRLRRGLG